LFEAADTFSTHWGGCELAWRMLDRAFAPRLETMAWMDRGRRAHLHAKRLSLRSGRAGRSSHHHKTPFRDGPGPL